MNISLILYKHSAHKLVKALALIVFLVLTLLCAVGRAESYSVNKDISCVKGNDNDIGLKCKLDSTNPMGSINFNKSLNTSGWDTLYITINDDNKYLSDVDEMFAVGWAEGYVTFKSISDNYDNTMSGVQLSSEVTAWIKQHISFMEGISRGKDEYSIQLARLIGQLKGIASGYKEGCEANKDNFQCTPLDFFHIFLLNFQNEIGDVQNAFTKGNENTKDSNIPIHYRDHCSALIKPVKDDLFFSHVTWSGFETMYRQYKTYNLRFRDSEQFVTMSGYPGIIHSIDDWYMTGARLTVMETTNGVYNNTLYVEYLKDNTMVVSEFLRTMIANYLAKTAKDWVDIWGRYPSGTYNNQWMVLDMKQYTPNEECPKGAFYVVETVPGTVMSADVSDVLNKQGYWASYNLPYFKEIQDLSGVTELERETGDFFNYNKYARARIFKRDHTTVTDIKSMMNLMRYNNYKHDDFSLISNCSAAKDGKCNPPYSAMLSIASRGDLNPAVPQGMTPIEMYGVNYRYLSQRDHCGTDAKIASYKGMMNEGMGSSAVFTATVVSGPTTSNGLPPFDVATSPFPNLPWKGLPTGQWLFPVIEMTVKNIPAIPDDTPQYEVRSIGIGLVTVGAMIVFATISILIFTTFVKEKDPADYVEV